MDFPHNPAHPGDVIREGCLGDEPSRSSAPRPRSQRFEQLVEDRDRITPSLALRMQAVSWSTASFCVQWQADYDRDQETLRQGRAAWRAANPEVP